jgi:nodulation protein A
MPDVELFARLVPEHDVMDADNEAIKRLLVAAFPRHVAIFSAASYWGARPEFRLWLETPDRTMVAHLDIERRAILVGHHDVTVAGVGEVATHPDWQGKGIGRRLMAELHAILRAQLPVPFGFLNCREAVVGFYASIGWHRVTQSMREIDPHTGQWTEHTGPAMILPVLEPIEAWPHEGLIDLRGLPW